MGDRRDAIADNHAMRSLLERPPDEELVLLRAIADGYAVAGRWPVWQWVAGRLRDEGDLDADNIIASMPIWQHNYRPALTVANAGSLPSRPGDVVMLTAVGMFHAGAAASNELLSAIVAAVCAASERQAAARPPTPNEAVPVTVSGADLAREVADRTGDSISPADLLAALRYEPHVWGGLVEAPDPADWYWDLDIVRLHSFRGVHGGEDYLQRMALLVEWPQRLRTEEGLGPSALPDAFDHLSTAWRLATGDWLLRICRVSSISRLCEPVTAAADFWSACSALADVIAAIELPGEGKSLARLEAELTRRLEAPDRALQGVQVLRHAVAIRAEQQHSGSNAAKQADKARVALGLDRFGTDWPSAWNHLRAVVVGGLRTIREELDPLLPA
jgi:hypothetical protein